MNGNDERFQHLIDNSADAIVIVDSIGVVQYVNRAAEVLFGRTQEDLLNSTFGSPVVQDLIEIEIVRSADAHPAWAEMRVVEVAYRGEQVFVASLRDITERKHAAMMLEKRTRALQALHEVTLDITAELDMQALLKRILVRAVGLLETSGGAVFLHDSQQNKLCVVETLGLSGFVGVARNPEEGLSGRIFSQGQSLVINDYSEWNAREEMFDVLSPASVLGIPLRWQSAILGVLVLFNTDSFRRFGQADIDLAELYVDLVTVAIKNAEWHQRLQFQADDLRRNVDRQNIELRRQEDRLATVLQNIDNAVVLTGIEGRVSYVNRAFTTLLGYADQEILGLSIENVSAELAYRITQQGLQGEFWQGEMAIRHKNDSSLEVDVAVVPIIGPGSQIESIVVSLRDIGRFKQLDRMKTRFMHHISHQLKTPLSNILLSTHLLKASKSPEIQNRQLEALDLQTHRLIAMTEKVIEATRLADRNAISNREQIQIAIVIEQAISRYQDLAERTGVQLIHNPPLVSLMVVGDSFWLARALGELIENAVNSTASGGNIQISAEHCIQQGSSMVKISIADSGIGIGADDLDRIMSDLDRGKRHDAGNTPGLGLGLTIVRMIIEQHNGSLEVRSKGIPGMGTVVVLHLPEILSEAQSNQIEHL